MIRRGPHGHIHCLSRTGTLPGRSLWQELSEVLSWFVKDPHCLPNCESNPYIYNMINMI